MGRNFRFNITQRLGLGFGILVVVILVASHLTYTTLNENLKNNTLIKETYRPSVAKLRELQGLIIDTKLLIKNWVFIDLKENTPDKLKLKEIHQNKYPHIKKSLKTLSKNWSVKNREELHRLFYTIDSLFEMHTQIMQSLDNFDAYDNPAIILSITPMVEEAGEVMTLTRRINARLNKIIEYQQKIVNQSNEMLNNSFASFKNEILIIAIVLVIATITVALLIANSIVRPLIRLHEIIYSMSKGILPSKNIPERSDEIGDMSEALSKLIAGLKKTSNFSREIGNGDFNTHFQPLSNDDELGNSLLLMRDNLRNADIEHKQRIKEERQRQWTSQGLTEINEILRQDIHDIPTFAFAIIQHLVNYMDVNQGGLFIINDEDKNNVFIELAAAYAFEQKKILKKHIAIGEGLVGRCVQENETIYMTDIPTSYINITSGLGKANPRSLLIVPLKLNKETFGVIELADFNEIPDFKIHFLERIGESIASAIARAKINANTKALFSQLQEQSEEMKMQEESMRQTIEQLQYEKMEMDESINENEQKIRELRAKSSHKEQELHFVREDLKRKTEKLDRLQEENKQLIEKVKYLKEELRKVKNFERIKF